MDFTTVTLHHDVKNNPILTKENRAKGGQICISNSSHGTKTKMNIKNGHAAHECNFYSSNNVDIYSVYTKLFIQNYSKGKKSA